MKLRGDDDLADLLAELSGEPAASELPEIASQETPPDTAASAAESAEHYEPETGWNSQSIWNPHVSAGAAVAQCFEASAGAALPATPQLECLRQQALGTLRSRFSALGLELGIKLKNETFEKWQFGQKLSEQGDAALPGDDPLIPRGAFRDKALGTELKELGAQPQLAANAVKELERAAKSALQALHKLMRTQLATRKHATAKQLDADTWSLAYGKHAVRINSAHYAKLQQLHSRHSSSSSSSSSAQAFHDALFACLLRYESLQGGGFQAAITGDVFNVLLQRFGVRMECFASPFNCRYAPFCTAFPDSDAVFGGAGSFFAFKPQRGSYEANPPFVPVVMLKMAHHINTLLKAADAADTTSSSTSSVAGEALCFVVIVPAWEGTKAWSALKDSSFMRRHVLLEQREHGYCEGRQQMRRTRYRLASAPTSVFFMQTRAAAVRSVLHYATYAISTVCVLSVTSFVVYTV
jgi:Phosphorylated CTD interacting factor 1 WW domain